MRICGLGVIDDAVLELAPGLTVVSGETGAGKTMVVTGLGLLFGGRADPGAVRPGADAASVLAVEVLTTGQGAGVLWCDGRRAVDLPPGARIEARRGAQPVRLARLHTAPFTDRLVAKFDLPVLGWRGRVPSEPPGSGRPPA